MLPGTPEMSTPSQAYAQSPEGTRPEAGRYTACVMRLTSSQSITRFVRNSSTCSAV